MNMSLKVSALATVLLTLMSSTSIPAAMSKPADLYTPIERAKDPVYYPAHILETDKNPNGAQVRVLFKLRQDEKQVCSDVNVLVETRDDSKRPDLGGLIGDAPIVSRYRGKLSTSTSGDNTCIFNFALKQRDIGNVAYISLGGVYNNETYLRYSVTGRYALDVKNIKQTFRVGGTIASIQVN